MNDPYIFLVVDSVITTGAAKGAFNDLNLKYNEAIQINTFLFKEQTGIVNELIKHLEE